MPALTPKQARFVDEYLLDLMNGKQAAIRAGYSPASAEVEASRSLRNAKVEAAVAAAMTERSRRTGISQDRVLREYARIAFANPCTVISWDASGLRLRPSEELSEDERAIIAEVGQTEHGLRLKLHSKLEALKMLGQHLGMWVDRSEVKVEVTRKPSDVLERRRTARLSAGTVEGRSTVVRHQAFAA